MPDSDKPKSEGKKPRLSLHRPEIEDGKKPSKEQIRKLVRIMAREILGHKPKE